MNKIYFLSIVYIFSIIYPNSIKCGSPQIDIGKLKFTDNELHSIKENALNRSETTFYVRNLDAGGFDEIDFQLLNSNRNSFFYGEISEIENGNIDIDIMNAIFEAFVSSTPDADSLSLTGGIRAAEESMLGSPPVINGQMDVNVLFMDIRDGYNQSGEFIAGFFDPNDQFLCYESTYNENSETVWSPNYNRFDDCNAPNIWASAGNGSNILYIDTNPSFSNLPSIESILFTLAHEYQHLLHWSSDIKEGYFGSLDDGWTFHNPWINEGLSDLMASILGFGERNYDPFLINPTIGLDDWPEIGSSTTLPYYAKSALYFKYLYLTNGADFIKSIFTNQMQGFSSIKDASELAETTFEDLFIYEWIFALSDTHFEGSMLNVDPIIPTYNLSTMLPKALGETQITLPANLNPYSQIFISVPGYIDVNAINSLNTILFNGSEDYIYLGTGTNELIEVTDLDQIMIYSEEEGNNFSFNLNYNFNNKFSIYPNPLINSKIISISYLESSTIDSDLNINIFDLKGRLILEEYIQPDINGLYREIINLNLSSGIYFVTAELDSKIPEKTKLTIIK